MSIERQTLNAGPPTDRPNRALVVLLGTVVALASAAVFLGTLDAQLLNFDDDVYITDNPLIKDRTWGSLSDLLTRRQLGVYNPLPLLVFSAEHALWGEEPAGYHAVNVAFHGLNAALLFALVLILSRRPYLAFAAALLWGVHPLRVESVAWASQLKEMLGAFFFLGALVLYLHRERSRSAYWLAIAAGLLAVMCKPIYVTLPAMVLLAELCRTRRLGRAALLRVVPFAVISAGWTVLSLVLVQEEAASIAYRSMSERLAAAVYLLRFYIRLHLWPIDLHVTYPTPDLSLGSAEVLLAAAALLAFLAAAALLFRRTTLPLFACGFYLIALSPMLGLVLYPGALCSDRYTYLGSAGLLLFVLLGADALLRRPRAHPALLAVLAAAVALPLGVLTLSQAEVWTDNETLWQREVDARPDSVLAQNNLGCACKRSGRLDAAAYHLRLAADLGPDEFFPRANLGDIHFRRQQFAQAAQWYQAACHRAPERFALHIRLGRAQLYAGRPDDAAKAFETAHRLKPDYYMAPMLWGKALKAAGRAQQAVAAFQTALRIEPDLFFLHVELGDLYADQLGDPAKAASHYRKALALAPHPPPPHFKDMPRVRRRLAELDSTAKKEGPP